MASKSKKKERGSPRKMEGFRPFWSGTISFGLVSVPVSLFPAQRHTHVGLRMLAPDGTPLSRRYYCPREGTEVPPEHIVRGYPTGDDGYVRVTDEELEALEPRKSREIDCRSQESLIALIGSKVLMHPSLKD